MKKSKKSLLFSVVSLLVCIAMLAGSTYAWFTDTVTSGVNQIVAGNLDIELYHSSKSAAKEAVSSTTKLFNDVSVWEPGAVDYETLTISNLGNLSLNYRMSVLAENETVVDGHGLSEVLKIGTIDGEVASGTTREQLIASVSSWVPLGSFTKSSSLDALTEEDPVTYVIYWQPSDDDNIFNMKNENQGKSLSIDFGISLIAGQQALEEDSFSSEYDLDAFQIVTPENFDSVIAGLKGGENLYLQAGTYTPANRETLKILVDDVTIVGAGKDITIIDAQDKDVSDQAALYVAANNITIANMTIKSSYTASKNLSPIKVTGYLAEDTGKVFKNFKLDNVALECSSGHGLNLHGVDGAIISKVDIRSFGKCGISCAKATNVTISNTKIAADGWGEDLGCMYSATEGNVYNSPCSITFGSGNELNNGVVKSERPSTATGGVDSISGLDSPWIKKTAEDGTFSYKPAAAKIGDAYYLTLAEAIEAAGSGDTIKLLASKITVADYVGDDSDNPYGKYTAISANQGTVGEAMPASALANVVLRKKTDTRLEDVTIEGLSETSYTELGSLDFSGSQNITVRYLKFDAANAVKAAVSSDKVTVSFKDDYFANVIDCSFGKFSTGGTYNSAAKGIVIHSCLFVGDGSAKHASILVYGVGLTGTHPTDWQITMNKFETKHIYGYLMIEGMEKGQLAIANNTFGAADSEGHYSVMTGSNKDNMTTFINGNIFNLYVNDAEGTAMSLGGVGEAEKTVSYTILGNTVNNYGLADNFVKIKNCSQYVTINGTAAISGNAETLKTVISGNNTGVSEGASVSGSSLFGPVAR